MPNRKPEASGGKSLRMSDMSGSNQRHDEHGGDACCHECSGRHHRTLRQAADAAHAVAAGAAATETRSETDEQPRSEEHTSELQSLMRISYAVFCLKKKYTYTTIKLN